MNDIVDRIMALWLTPPPDDEAAAEAFRALYTDPVLINGAPLPAIEHVVIAFLMRGIHSGPYRTPLGEVAPTGQQVAIRTIDVLTVTAGRVSEVWWSPTKWACSPASAHSGWPDGRGRR